MAFDDGHVCACDVETKKWWHSPPKGSRSALCTYLLHSPPASASTESVGSNDEDSSSSVESPGVTEREVIVAVHWHSTSSILALLTSYHRVAFLDRSLRLLPCSLTSSTAQPEALVQLPRFNLSSPPLISFCRYPTLPPRSVVTNKNQIALREPSVWHEVPREVVAIAVADRLTTVFLWGGAVGMASRALRLKQIVRLRLGEEDLVSAISVSKVVLHYSYCVHIHLSVLVSHHDSSPFCLTPFLPPVHLFSDSS